MATLLPPSRDDSLSSPKDESLAIEKGEAIVGIVAADSASSFRDKLAANDPGQSQRDVPLSWKLISIVLVTAIGFGSQWSSGITAAMKTTLKKELHINNTQFSLLEASEDFMITALMLVSGVVTDRIGGAGVLILKFGCRTTDN